VLALEAGIGEVVVVTPDDIGLYCPMFASCGQELVPEELMLEEQLLLEEEGRTDAAP
jgi:hypothetical protein